MTRTISTLTSNVCIAHIGHEEDGSQEDWRIAFKYNYDTQVCQIGKVPFQLVRVVQDWVALNGSMPFVNNGNPELLYVCHGCMGGERLSSRYSTWLNRLSQLSPRLWSSVAILGT